MHTEAEAKKKMSLSAGEAQQRPMGEGSQAYMVCHKFYSEKHRDLFMTAFGWGMSGNDTRSGNATGMDQMMYYLGECL